MVALKDLLLEALELAEGDEFQEDEASTNLCSDILSYLKVQKKKLINENITDENVLKEQNILIENIKSTEEINDGVTKAKEKNRIHKHKEVRVTGRIQQLAEPKQICPITGREYPPFQIPKAALKYRASYRIRKLAKPVVRDTSNISRQVFHVKKAALKARCSQRLQELAKPARSSSPQALPSLQFYPPVLQQKKKKILTITGHKPYKLTQKTKIKSI